MILKTEFRTRSCQWCQHRVLYKGRKSRVTWGDFGGPEVEAEIRPCRLTELINRSCGESQSNQPGRGGPKRQPPDNKWVKQDGAISSVLSSCREQDEHSVHWALQCGGSFTWWSCYILEEWFQAQMPWTGSPSPHSFLTLSFSPSLYGPGVPSLFQNSCFSAQAFWTPCNMIFSWTMFLQTIPWENFFFFKFPSTDVAPTHGF